LITAHSSVTDRPGWINVALAVKLRICALGPAGKPSRDCCCANAPGVSAIAHAIDIALQIRILTVTLMAPSTPETLYYDSLSRASYSAAPLDTNEFPRRTASAVARRNKLLDFVPYFYDYGNMLRTAEKFNNEGVAKYADMFSALGTEARLRIMQLLLSSHPDGLVVNEIQEELDIPSSTLSHHLDKLKNEGLVSVQRESTFLRYTANTAALQEILRFLYAECCTRSKALKRDEIIRVCR
jgi:DNA-binding transcriptional ArsR family regulator